MQNADPWIQQNQQIEQRTTLIRTTTINKWTTTTNNRDHQRPNVWTGTRNVNNERSNQRKRESKRTTLNISGSSAPPTTIMSSQRNGTKRCVRTQRTHADRTNDVNGRWVQSRVMKTRVCVSTKSRGKCKTTVNKTSQPKRCKMQNR